ANMPATQPNDAPPAYTASVSSLTTTPSSTGNTSTTRVILAAADDDPYAFLSTFDTLFLIDDSGSMAGRSWRETAAALEAITPICTAHDAD
ncbi:hypothetical protein LTS18_010880, partial [Coniosporium uncinatum]